MKKNKVCIVGMGYVGIPMIVATLISKKTKFEVIGIEKMMPKVERLFRFSEKEKFHLIQTIKI